MKSFHFPAYLFEKFFTYGKFKFFLSGIIENKSGKNKISKSRSCFLNSLTFFER